VFRLSCPAASVIAGRTLPGITGTVRFQSGGAESRQPWAELEAGSTKNKAENIQMDLNIKCTSF
jgi:hypothetical protein